MKQKGKWISFILLLTLISSSIGGVGGYYLATNVNSTVDTSNNNNVSPIKISNKDTKDNSSLSQIMDSVVEINTQTQYYGRFRESYSTEGAGSGVIVNGDGYILTNYHVIEDTSKILVRLTNGNEYDATIVDVDKENDLALLKISPTETLTSATLGNSDNLEVGQYVLAIGNPLGTLGGSVTEGIISAKDREITVGDTTMKLLQTTAAINSGNSGGGLFDSDGSLIGIVNAKSSGLAIEGLGFAIPIQTVKEFLNNTLQSVPISEV